jgi:oligoribonuclease NrnB/cAMP/cGMP phosphodiesterase (DHH superfamily)
MKPLVIYHGNCADGFGAAWCFWNEFGDDFEYHAGVYQQPPPDVTGREVFLVDFSYKFPVMQEMLDKCQLLTILDHHKTAVDEVAALNAYAQGTGTGKLRFIMDMERSGAMIAWNYLHDSPPPQLIAHIQDRDLWQFKLEGTREIQAALFSYEYDFKVWDGLMLGTASRLQELRFEGETLERKHFKDINELLKVCKRRMVIGGVDVPVASLPYTMSSDAGHIMGVGEPFAACYYDEEAGRNFSLRSAEDGIDVSEIAKQYGGGGHKHAAGFRVPRDHILATS